MTILPPDTTDPGVPAPAVNERPRFQPIEEIGAGAVGQVVAAQDLDIGRRVAIKRLRPERRTEGNFLRFVQEVRTAGQLEHPNIVPIHDVGREEDGNYYIVMKYIDGETLEAVIERLKAGDPAAHEHWRFERRVEVFAQILQAVRFAHDRGVLHRDLKPANIMIGSHGEVHLLDWGIAKRRPAESSSAQADTWIGDSLAGGTGAETRAGALVGTPRYMAPEQARGEVADARSETYTLSLIFYELLTLSHPREGIERVDELLNFIQRTAVPHPRALRPHPKQGLVPIELAWIAASGLSIDPTQRYPTVASMIEVLRRRSNGEVNSYCWESSKKATLLKMIQMGDRYPITSWLLIVLPLIGAAVSIAALVGALIALIATVGVVWLS